MEIVEYVSPKMCLTPLEEGITSLEIRSCLLDEETEECISIGKGSGYVFENPFDDDELEELLDTVSGDTYALHNVLTDTEEGRDVLESAVSIVYIQSIELKPEYRGKGIGLRTMKFVIDHFCNGCNLILLHPAPLDKKADEGDREIAIRKLGEHWSTVGFQRLGTSAVYYILW